jgi:hypothetical protein
MPTMALKKNFIAFFPQNSFIAITMLTGSPTAEDIKVARVAVWRDLRVISITVLSMVTINRTASLIPSTIGSQLKLPTYYLVNDLGI